VGVGKQAQKLHVRMQGGGGGVVGL
jgi:hypothetical protein